MCPVSAKSVHSRNLVALLKLKAFFLNTASGNELSIWRPPDPCIFLLPIYCVSGAVATWGGIGMRLWLIGRRVGRPVLHCLAWILAAQDRCFFRYHHYIFVNCHACFPEHKKLRHTRTCAASNSFLSGYFKEGKDKFVALYVTKAYEGNGVTETLTLNLGARWTSVEPPEKWSASAPEPFCTVLKKTRLSFHVTNPGSSGSLSSECTN